MKRGLCAGLAALLILLCACGSGEEDRLERANGMITAVLTLPCPAYNEAWDALNTALAQDPGLSPEELSSMTAQLEEDLRAAVTGLVGAYVEPEYLENILKGDPPAHLLNLAQRDRSFTLRPLRVTLDQSQGDKQTYVFDASVGLAVEGRPAEELLLAGQLQFSDEGLIRWLEVYSGPLTAALNGDAAPPETP